MAGFGAGFRSSSSSSDYLRGAEMDLTLRDIAARYLGTDWFSRDENVRRDGLRSAAAHGGFGDRDGWSMEEAVRIDDVRRVNAMAQMANSIVTPQMRHAEIQPKLSTANGQFPRDFELPKRVEEFLVMDNSLLDRILLSYSLPRDSHALSSPLSSPLSAPHRFGRDRDQFDGFHLEDSRRARLLALFEYLGVDVSGERRFGERGGLASGLGGGLGGLGGRSGTRLIG